MSKLRLREVRIEHGYKQAEIAKVLGVTRSTYTHYENESRSIPPEAIVTLANFYRCSSDELLGTNIYKYYYSTFKDE